MSRTDLDREIGMKENRERHSGAIEKVWSPSSSPAYPVE
jgi:hypothetical protein